MPYEYIVALIDYVTTHFEVNILFNYAPDQKVEVTKIYNACKHQDAIIFDVYEASIRGFIALMNQCQLLIANEGGIVHIAKALDKPTFTIFSPYVIKSHWASFEDGQLHTSVHLLDQNPDLFSTSREDRKKIEENPSFFYEQLTPELILEKLSPFLKHHI
jgi:heptosyltransferase-2